MSRDQINITSDI